MLDRHYSLVVRVMVLKCQTHYILVDLHLVRLDYNRDYSGRIVAKAYPIHYSLVGCLRFDLNPFLINRARHFLLFIL